jgi:hypothetical protein
VSERRTDVDHGQVGETEKDQGEEHRSESVLQKAVSRMRAINAKQNEET